MAKNRFKEGWSAKEHFINPLERQGIPIAIAEAFLKFMTSEKPYPFVPNERLFSVTFWEEEDVENALSQLTGSLF